MLSPRQSQERGRMGESWEQAQALPWLSQPFWTKSASVGMFVELRASSRRVSSIAAAFCPVGRKSLPTELEAIMQKRKEMAWPIKMARVRPGLIASIACVKGHQIVFCGALGWQRHACSRKPASAHHPAIGHQFGKPNKN